MSELPPLGVDVWYAVHFVKNGKKSTRWVCERRVADRARFFAQLREEHILTGGVVEEFADVVEYEAARLAALTL